MRANRELIIRDVTTLLHACFYATCVHIESPNTCQQSSPGKFNLFDILDNSNQCRQVQLGKETFVSYAKTGEEDVPSSMV